MKTMYHVRIEDDVKGVFMNETPWGSQGEVLEALLALVCTQYLLETPSMVVAKLTAGKYKLVEKT